MSDQASSTATSPQYVPYQAYKPKRHSRNFSNTTTQSMSRPSSMASSPIVSPHHRPLPDEDAGSVNSFSLSQPTVTANGAKSPAIRVEMVSNAVNDHSLSSPSSIQAQGGSEPQSSSRKHNLVDASEDTTSSSPLSVTPSPLSPATSKSKKTTTFRRLAPKVPSSALIPSQPSPHSRNASTSSLPGNIPSPVSQVPNPIQGRMEVTDRHRTTSLMSPSTSRTVPLSPLNPLPAPHPEPTLRTSSRSSEGYPHPRPPSLAVQPVSRSHSVAGRSDSSRATSPIASPSSLHRPKSAPYRPGFQPKGVIAQRTDEFLAIRRLKRDGDGEAGRLMRIERNKLERRLEKLVALHFPPQVAASESEKGDPMAGPTVPNGSLRKKKEPHIIRRASSFFDLDKVKNLKLNDPGDLWRGVVGGLDPGGKEDIRGAEQRITPWEEDSAVSKCPLCLASFHPLTNRKHHCRLCGKIICSLPPKAPQRPAMCSLLFFVDSKTRKIEEVGEGVDYGVRRRNRPEGEDKFLKSVRICRTCRPVIQRQQYLQQVEDVPVFFKLYDIFINLEKDIEDSLPQFQELLLTLSHNDQPTKEASAARKRLLEAFAQYDRLSKQIRALPCPNGSGSSQDRVQTSILTRASLFLQKNMFPLQSLPRPSALKDSQPPSNGSQSSLNPAHIDHGLDIDPDSELARALQPLLEQEALLGSFIDEAKAQRKFEDVKTLKRNQDEIRREIENLLDSAGIIHV